MNKLFYGDNLIVLRHLLDSGMKNKINLIYIDPPFFSKQKYKTFDDRWNTINDYLEFLKQRIVLMKELLAKNGSIYVHLDWHASHYVKVMLDEIFGYDNFVNEIIWFFRGTTNSPRKFADKHDTIFLYAKDREKYKFNADEIRIPYQGLKAYKKDENGKWYKQWTKDRRYYPPQDFIDGKWVLRGKYMYDVIDFIPSMSTAHGEEYLGFPTQKKEELLKIFILASSDKEDVVADFFCGSGTTLAVAEKLGRRWIGCDNSKEAINTTINRLKNIENSKDLIEKGKRYGKKCSEFELIFSEGLNDK